MDSTINSDRLGSYVKLNVGGSLFYSTIGTLNRGNTMLNAMFSGRMDVKTDDEGWVLLDRCGKHFGSILNYLRDDTVPLPDSRQEVEELLMEARFYCIEGLRTDCEEKLAKLSQLEDTTLQQAIIVIVKYPEAAKAILSSTRKPVVKLTMNRYNNVFSYTNNSHDNLLRNIECLEKYALMFAHSVLFVKDVRDKSEQNEICEWSYYCRGHKLKSIDCIAIHYSSERRLIKVEFPESRIHEEMLFLLSIVPRDLSDAELMEIALRKGSGGQGGGGGASSVGSGGLSATSGGSILAHTIAEREEPESDQASAAVSMLPSILFMSPTCTEEASTSSRASQRSSNASNAQSTFFSSRLGRR